MQMPILRTDAENRHRLQTLLRRGEIVRVHRGIYVPARLATIPEIRAGAACAAVPCGVASHDTAAALWNIELVTPSGAEHVTVPVARPRASWSTLTVHASDLRPEDVVEWRELRATSPLRTVRDLLRTCDRLTGVWAVEQALACKMIGRDELVADLRSLAARRSCSLADERSESPLETGIRLTLIDAGLPAPELQIPIRDGAFRIDMGYRKRRIGIEADGRAVHDVPKAIYADRRRANALNQLGWRLLRFTWRDLVAQPEYIVRTVRSALDAAAA